MPAFCTVSICSSEPIEKFRETWNAADRYLCQGEDQQSKLRLGIMSGVSGWFFVSEALPACPPPPRRDPGSLVCLAPVQSFFFCGRCPLYGAIAAHRPSPRPTRQYKSLSALFALLVCATVKRLNNSMRHGMHLSSAYARECVSTANFSPW